MPECIQQLSAQQVERTDPPINSVLGLRTRRFIKEERYAGCAAYPVTDRTPPVNDRLVDATGE